MGGSHYVTNMTHNCCKTWATISKLSKNPTTSKTPCLVSGNQVAYPLLVNGRDTMLSKHNHPILPPAIEGDASTVHPFSKEEYRKGVAVLKKNKAAGRDDVLVVQLKI